MRSHAVAALLALSLLTVAPAAAQDMGTVLPNNYVLSDILNKQRVDAAIATPSGPRRAAPAPRAKPPGVQATSTAYRASPAVSARVRKQFSEWMGRQAGAENGRKIGQLLAANDPVRNWAGIVGGDGLRPGDAADAMAGYWILNWVMANGGDNDRAQAQAVRGQVRGMMATNPAFSRLDEAGRQELAETLMLNFLIQHAAYVDARQRNDQGLMRKLGDAAQARFRSEMGVELRDLRLTPAGFVRR